MRWRQHSVQPRHRSLTASSRQCSLAARELPSPPGLVCRGCICPPACAVQDAASIMHAAARACKCATAGGPLTLPRKPALPPAAPSCAYRCVAGRGYVYNCQAGLQFNDAIQACDWPYNMVRRAAWREGGREAGLSLSRASGCASKSTAQYSTSRFNTWTFPRPAARQVRQPQPLAAAAPASPAAPAQPAA